MTISNTSSGGMGRPFVADQMADLPEQLISVIQDQPCIKKPLN